MAVKKTKDDQRARGFLNKGCGLAAWEWHVDDQDYAHLTLSDCSRQITLDFDLDSPYRDYVESEKQRKIFQSDMDKAYKLANYKLHTLQKILADFEAVLESRYHRRTSEIQKMEVKKPEKK